MANVPPSEKFPPWLKPLATPLTVGGRHFSTRPGAALPHVGSLPLVLYRAYVLPILGYGDGVCNTCFVTDRIFSKRSNSCSKAYPWLTHDHTT